VGLGIEPYTTQSKDVLIILPFLHLSHTRLKFIFQTATMPCPPLIVKGGGHGGTRMFTPGIVMISLDLVEA
jgi:hypothetical protein